MLQDFNLHQKQEHQYLILKLQDMLRKIQTRIFLILEKSIEFHFLFYRRNYHKVQYFLHEPTLKNQVFLDENVNEDLLSNMFPTVAT